MSVCDKGCTTSHIRPKRDVTLQETGMQSIEDVISTTNRTLLEYQIICCFHVTCTYTQIAISSSDYDPWEHARIQHVNLS